jgi:acyl carrier protein
MPAETHVEGGPIGPDEVFRMIRERLGEILEVDESVITLDSNFADDLNADSLALIELVEALEDELGERTVGFSIDDEDLGDLRTVRDAVDYVTHRLAGSEQGGPSEQRG